ncbi:Kremen protein 1 [Holothuria leucospilota]|uniref:Kremen protein 1 n=1 Tax=Holothuria leucospilota TaxID=206669 RepID=A0A9Q1BUU3_HOLLE|nr:Kremen protein 1 [Holothuria leucospilota]
MKQPVHSLPMAKVWLSLLLFAVFKYVGCYVDDFDRILPNYDCVETPNQPDSLCSACVGPRVDSAPGTGAGCQNSNMTIEFCFMVCRQEMFVYAGLEAGSECYCGNATANYEKYPSAGFTKADCSTPCIGDMTQYCGADFLVNVYDLRKSACTVDNLDTLIIPNEQTVNVAFDVDHILSFTCQAGYILSGQGSSTCQLDGTWIPSIPTCLDAPDIGDLNANQGGDNDVTSTNGNNTEKCRVGQNREEQSRAEQCRGVHSSGEQSSAEQSSVEQSSVEQWRAEQCGTEQCRGVESRAVRSRQGRAGQSIIK